MHMDEKKNAWIILISLHPIDAKKEKIAE